MLEHKLTLLQQRASHSEASQTAAAADAAAAAVKAAQQAAAEAEARRSDAVATAKVCLTWLRQGYGRRIPNRRLETVQLNHLRDKILIMIHRLSGLPLQDQSVRMSHRRATRIFCVADDGST